MITTYEPLLTSSFLLYLNNRIQAGYSGIYNVGTQLYSMPFQSYYGLYTYSTPFKPWIYDASVPGATVMTGVILNGVPITKGQSGLVEFDYEHGDVYFSAPLPVGSILSGNYSFSEVDVVLSSYPDINQLFETRLTLRPKQPQTPTGRYNNQLSYPTIYLKNEIGNNKPWAFGGNQMTETTINAYIFAESQFQLDNICSCFKDANYQYVPYINQSEFPMNNYGGFKNNIPYNYTGLIGNRVAQGQGVLISDVSITDWGRRGINAEISRMTTESFFSLVTFKLTRERITQ